MFYIDESQKGLTEPQKEVILECLNGNGKAYRRKASGQKMLFNLAKAGFGKASHSKAGVGVDFTIDATIETVEELRFGKFVVVHPKLELASER